MRYWDSHVMYLDEQMVLLNPNTPDPKKTITNLEPVKGTTFKLVTKFRTFSYGSDGENVSFEFEPNGKVKRVKIGDIFSEPIEF